MTSRSRAARRLAPFPAVLALMLANACSLPAGLVAPAAPLAAAPPQDAFFAALSSHCGKAYAGRLVSRDAADADFIHAPMVVHLGHCSEDRVAAAFHVELPTEDGARAWDRSRTWVFTRTATGLRLKHDHRHANGEADAVTMYGGDTAPGDPGTARLQRFPVDADSVALFTRAGLAASVTNVWSVEVDPAGTSGALYAYQLQRTVAQGAPSERLFRVEFDLSKPVELPPPAWGW
jgi:hypothetical protein